MTPFKIVDGENRGLLNRFWMDARRMCQQVRAPLPAHQLPAWGGELRSGGCPTSDSGLLLGPHRELKEAHAAQLSELEKNYKEALKAEKLAAQDKLGKALGDDPGKGAEATMQVKGKGLPVAMGALWLDFQSFLLKPRKREWLRMKLKKGNHINKQPLYPEKLEGSAAKFWGLNKSLESQFPHLGIEDSNTCLYHSGKNMKAL